jgi:hypothetical protein
MERGTKAKEELEAMQPRRSRSVSIRFSATSAHP